ncbi:MAG: SirA-like protein [Nitrospira bacterium SM23_35]|jgi:tRNA 2-thiouridine synthesizing protein A|nr:MAG: SirA-like protein [Nitrospira bacterium SM23_35]
MATEVLDTKGLKCPQPLQKIAIKYVDMKQGEILEVIGDCPTFEKDVRIWCERMGKTLLFCRNEDNNGTVRCQIQC